MSREPSIVRAGLWMAGWLACMLTMAVAGREATSELHVFEVMFLRSALGLAVLVPLIMHAGGLGAVRSRQPLRHVGRNIVHYGAQFSWFYALTLIPLAQVVAIEFTMPIWTAVLAVPFLGERMHVWKAAAIVLGLAGVLIIVRPGFDAVETGQVFALVAAIGFGVSVTLTKALTRRDSPTTIMVYMLAVQAAIGLVPALGVWQWPSAHIWPWVAVIAFVGTFSHYCMASAMQHAEATVVVPMDFLRVPLTAIAGWLLYNELIDVYTFGGAVLILAGNLLNLKEAGTARIRA